jgi:GGDEF domain-containing protein
MNGTNNDFQENIYPSRVEDENSSFQSLDFFGHKLNSNAVGILKEFCFSTSMIQITLFLEPRLFQDAFAREWSRIRRQKQHLSIIIFIIDSILDKKADELLSLREEIFKKQTCQAIDKNLDRPKDLFTYLEKGIFVLMLPSTQPEEASIVAQSIQQTVDNQTLAINAEGSSSSQSRLNLSFFIQGLVPSQPLSAQMLFDNLLFGGGSCTTHDLVGQSSANGNGRDIGSAMIEAQTRTIQSG